MTLLESFHHRTEGLPSSRSIPGQNDYPTVVLSQERMTTLDSFYPWTENCPGVVLSQDVQKDSPGAVLSQDRTTLLESFHPRTEGLHSSSSIPGQNDYPTVVLSQDRMTPLESFHLRTEWLTWSRSIPG